MAENRSPLVPRLFPAGMRNLLNLAALLLVISAALPLATAAPAIIPPITVDLITESSAVINWLTDVPSTSTVHYGTDTALLLNTTNTTLVMTHSIPIAALLPATTYFFKVESEAGGLSSSEIMTFATLDDTPPTITNVSRGSITGTTATIAWTTDEPADSVVLCGTEVAVLDVCGGDTFFEKLHVVFLIGLMPGTTYFYRVQSSDRSVPPNTSTSFPRQFTTQDLVGPVISDPLGRALTETTAVVTWTTNEPADSEVCYGTTPADLPVMKDCKTLNTDVTEHRVLLTGLKSGTKYFFRVRSKDAKGHPQVEAMFGDFTTPDETAPVISDVVSGVTGTKATIKWVTDEEADSQVEYGLDTTYGTQTALDPSPVREHGVTLGDLTPGTTYHYRVRSIDRFGNLAVSGDYTFTTDNATPEIDALSPDSAALGGPKFLLTVLGEGFVSGSVVKWDGVRLTTTFLGPTGLLAAVDKAMIAEPGEAEITVFNPDPGGGTSNVLTFSVLELVLKTPCFTLGDTVGLPDGTVGVPYLQVLEAEGGTEPLEWLLSGSLPLGLQLIVTGRISGTPEEDGMFEFGLIVQDQGNLTATATCNIEVNLPTIPELSFTLLPDAVAAAQQPTFGLQLVGAFPLDISGQVTLSVKSLLMNPLDMPTVDPSVQFNTGGRTVDFAIPANISTATFGAFPTASFQTGTVAATITLTAETLTARTTTGRVTKITTPSQAVVKKSVSVKPSAPSVTRVEIRNQTDTSFQVAITGYSTTREVTAVSLRFTAKDEATIIDPDIVSLDDAATLFNTWYVKDSRSVEYGGQFFLTLPITITGDANLLGSVFVTVTNMVMAEGDPEEVEGQF